MFNKNFFLRVFLAGLIIFGLPMFLIVAFPVESQAHEPVREFTNSERQAIDLVDRLIYVRSSRAGQCYAVSPDLRHITAVQCTFTVERLAIKGR